MVSKTGRSIVCVLFGSRDSDVCLCGHLWTVGCELEKLDVVPDSFSGRVGYCFCAPRLGRKTLRKEDQKILRQN